MPAKLKPATYNSLRFQRPEPCEAARRIAEQAGYSTMVNVFVNSVGITIWQLQYSSRKWAFCSHLDVIPGALDYQEAIAAYQQEWS